MTKIFCDIAELDLINKFNKKKIVKGFTTNPSLMRKAGAKDYKSYSKKILEICNNKPVSLEVFGDEYKEMKKQALQINTWGKNVYVKIPIVNSKGVFTGKVIKELNNRNIKLNITAVYMAKQTEKISLIAIYGIFCQYIGVHNPFLLFLAHGTPVCWHSDHHGTPVCRLKFLMYVCKPYIRP